jgi:hypothetical protein
MKNTLKTRKILERVLVALLIVFFLIFISALI